MSRELVIMRGLPGSGKSTLAREKWPEALVLSTDDYWGPDYNFVPTKIGQAHAWNQVRIIEAMGARTPLVIVDNTHCQQWEYSVVEAAARALGYGITILDLYDGGLTNQELALRNRHGVPAEAIARMRGRYER